MQEILGVDTMTDFVREGAQAQGLQNFPSCIYVSHSSLHLRAGGVGRYADHLPNSKKPAHASLHTRAFHNLEQWRSGLELG
jgi:hypothetical protein